MDPHAIALYLEVAILLKIPLLFLKNASDGEAALLNAFLLEAIEVRCLTRLSHPGFRLQIVALYMLNCTMGIY